jgi:hypothetical protein
MEKKALATGMSATSGERQWAGETEGTVFGTMTPRHYKLKRPKN